MPPSLRRHLTISVVLIFVASWLASAMIANLTARRVLQQETDRILEGVLLVAESIGRSLAADPSQQLQKIFSEYWVPVQDDQTPAQEPHADQKTLRLQNNLHIGTQATPSMNIWSHQSQLLIGEGTPVFASPFDGVPKGGVSDQTIGDSRWRVMYRYDAETDLWYGAGVSHDQAPFDGTRLLLQMLSPLALIIPLTVIALYYGIARGLQPLQRLAQEIEARQRRASLEPVPAGTAPQELVPVVEALNHLLARLADTLENEMRFTANAAHELQTPLAAISTEVQLCRRLLTDPESQQMMERIRNRVDRASHSVRQLLILARLDPQASLPLEPLNLFTLTQDVITELGHLASSRQLVLSLAVDESHTVMANREALLILLRNLINNAFRYTPVGGNINLQSIPQGIRIDNQSEPVVELEHLADRFHRGNHDSHGTGLGLSIVKRICELHSFSLHLNYHQADGVFTVTLDFQS